MQDPSVLNTIFSLAILIMSVVVHEVSHGLTANALGDPTARLSGRLTLNPLKHLDPVGSFLVPLITSMFGFTFGWAKPVPYNPYNLRAGKWGPGIVAFAGPASNILVAIFFGIVVRVWGAAGASQGVLEICAMAVFINIFLALFNMIPVPPLDGSKVLFSALPDRMYWVEDFFHRYQLILIFAILVFGLDRILLPLVVFLGGLII
ncbi:MAG: site-2 protease family protein [Candidatus Paceibacterota bacterium]|jgi:Zn-dependent protease